MAASLWAVQPTVTKVTLLSRQAGRLDWSSQGNLIAYDRVNDQGFFEIWSMHPDGSAQQCLTCGKAGAPSRHKGNPAYHPSGQWIVFQAERDDVDSSRPPARGAGRRLRRGGVMSALGSRQGRADIFGTPGRGFLNDLWITDASGDRYWKLVSPDPRVGGVLHPHFSPRGDKLAWAQRISSGDAVAGIGRGGFGEWDIRVADFGIADGIPRLSNVRKFQPGASRRLFETHGFTPDGRKLIFCAGPERGDNKLGLDVYLFDLQTKELTNLTDSPDEWDEHAQLSPDGTRIAWMSSKGMRLPARAVDLKTDFWIMNVDGSGKTRLTYFNDPGNPQYIRGGVAAADSSWSPDGNRLAGYLIKDPAHETGRIVMLDLQWRK